MQTGTSTAATAASPAEAPAEGHHVLGVYSKVKAAETGHGTTARTYSQTTYWFVRRIDDDTYSVQALNANSIPSGAIERLTKGEFMHEFRPEPGYYEKRCLPFIESLKKKLALGEAALQEEHLDIAEKEFCKALILDDKNPEANVGLGQIYLQQGNAKKLAATLRRILTCDALFQEEERHLFNQFGISLRKEGRFADAITFYEKAVEHNADDEHLQFNIARALVGAGDTARAQEHLHHALTLRPDFDPAHRFLAYLDALAAGGAPECPPDIEPDAGVES